MQCVVQIMVCGRNIGPVVSKRHESLESCQTVGLIGIVLPFPDDVGIKLQARRAEFFNDETGCDAALFDEFLTFESLKYRGSVICEATMLYQFPAVMTAFEDQITRAAITVQWNPYRAGIEDMPAINMPFHWDMAMRADDSAFCYIG